MDEWIYGGGFIYLFQHYFSFDSMLKPDSRQHCTKTKQKLHSELKHTLWRTIDVVHPMSWIYEMKKIKQIPGKLQKHFFLSGILKNHLTKDKHAIFYNIHGHYEKTDLEQQRTNRTQVDEMLHIHGVSNRHM